DGALMRAIVLVGALASAVFLFASASPAGAQAGDAQAGRAVYERKCALCHGEKGDGKGPGADLLDPRPRDFTTGIYKIRTTANKTPTDRDLFDVITRGMPGTFMPAWDVLPEKDRWNLVAYLKAFAADKFKEAPKKQELPKEVASSPESIRRGKEMYEAIECNKCHGAEGRADGPSRPELKDEWGHPIRPANLTKRWTFRGGGGRAEIAMRLTTGVLGTPMPSFIDSVEKPDDIWHLANYLASLGPESPHYATLLVAEPFPEKVAEGAAGPRFLVAGAAGAGYRLGGEKGNGATEASATGPTRIAPLAGGEVTGQAAYANGQYRLVLKRPLVSKGPDRPTFQPAVFLPIAFQAWDGGAGETGAKMSLTSWYYLRLEEPQSSRRFVVPPVVATPTFAAMLLVVRVANRRA